MNLGMKKPLQFSAIDLGSSKITTVIATRGEEDPTLRVVGVASVPSQGIRKSQVVDIDDAIEAATESVESAERMAGLTIRDATISVSGLHIGSENSKGLVAVGNPDAEITASDVYRVIEAAKAVPLPTAREILHVIPRFFLVDNQDGIKDPVGMSGVRLECEAHLVTGSSVNLKNLAKVMSELGIDLVGQTFGGLASAEGTLTETEQELGVVLLDIGGGTTSVCVYVEGALTHTSVIPVGGKNITNDIAIGLRVNLDVAEAIKRYLAPEGKPNKVLDPKNIQSKKASDEIDLTKLGLENAPRKLSRKAVAEGIVRPRLNEIFELVKADLHKAGLIGKTPAGLVLTGGGALTYLSSDSARKVLGLQSRLGIPRGLTGLTDELNSPEFSCVTGLLKLAAKSEIEPVTASSLHFPKLPLIPFRDSGKKFLSFIKSFLP